VLSGRDVIWVIDSSSIVDPKIVPHAIRPRVIRHLDALVARGQLVYPRQVLDELRSYAPPRALATDVSYTWAKGHESEACHPDRLIGEATEILAAYPDLIDPDAAGRDPAAPYIIALAQKLRRAGRDARIVTNDTRQINNKVSVVAVAGVLGIPSTVMRIFLRDEGFDYGASGATPSAASP
jgi:Domain of unknown function (DUF4411)